MRSLFTTSYEQNAHASTEADNHAKSDYQPFSVAVFQRLIKNYRYFADIGADYGYYTLVAQQQQPQIEVVAYESQPEKIALLKQNLRASKARKNLTTKLEKLCKLIQGNKKIFFRINAVGHEIEILEKIGVKLAKHPPLLVVFDPHDQVKGGTSPALLLKRLAQLGYLVYFLNETSYEYWQYELAKSEQWQVFTELAGPCNVLCVAPADKERLRTIFDDLLISKYAATRTQTTAILTSQLKKTKLVLRRKISQLSRKKHALDLKMTEIVTSDYFKIWQWFSNLTRRLRR